MTKIADDREDTSPHIYSAAIMQHFRQPCNSGQFASDIANIGRALVGDSQQGAVLQLQIQVHKEQISTCRFKAYGCGVMIATGSWLSQYLAAKSLQQARDLHNSDIISALQIPAQKVHCAVLAEQAINQAIDDYIAMQ